jgi:hypothetical protein
VPSFSAAKPRKLVMDHIPKVHNPFAGARSLVVPLLDPDLAYGDRSRGFAKFQSFPAEHGYGVFPFSYSKDGITKALPLIPFLQSWLYFGLLAEAFGKPRTHFDVHDFIRKDSEGNAFITSVELRKYAWYLNAMHWADESRLSAPDGSGWLMDVADEWLVDLDKCLQFAAATVNSLAGFLNLRQGINEFDTNLGTTVLLSIAVLAEYIHSLRENIFTFKPPAKLTFSLSILDQELLRAGWCEGEISSFMSDCNLTCRYLLSHIDRHVLRKDHSRCNQTNRCQAHQIQDHDSYRPAHALECGGQPTCEEIGPSIQDIINILKCGGIPAIIALPNDARSVVRIRIVQTQDVSSYVAISHVWSDGLGNPKGNRLNRCQLLSIQSRVNALYPTVQTAVPFWMDTLCVPVMDIYSDYHALALDRMAETYQSADKVLVLDNSLIQCNPDISTVEIGMRLRYSPWMGRLWTMQEGRLADKLFFQFDGRAIDGDILQDIHTITKNISSVDESLDGMVEKHGLEAVLQNPNSYKLIRALASHHHHSGHGLGMPNGSDKESDRPNAPVEQSIAQKWIDVLRKMGFNDPDFSDADEHYFEALRTQVFDSVTRHSLFAIQRVRGAGCQALLHAHRDAGPGSSECSGSAADSFSDVVRGFRGRTTSRLEDETICLGILTGVDLGLLRNAKCLDWNIKDVLKELLTRDGREDASMFREAGSVLKKRIEDRPGLLDNVGDERVRDFLAGLASGVVSSWVVEPWELHDFLNACHEQRMKTLLEIVAAPQQSIIFWNAPRLRFEGWGWAPFSMLHNDLDFPLIIGRRGKIRPNVGIEVRYPGFRLCNSIYDGLVDRRVARESSIDPFDTGGPIRDDVELVIHTVEDQEEEGHCPWRRSWEHVKLSDSTLHSSLDAQRSHLYLRYNRDGWADFVQSQRLNSMAIIVNNDQNHPTLNRAILVEEYREQGDVVFTRHVGLVERVGSSDRDRNKGFGREREGIHVWGIWVPDGIWCVG